MAPSTRTGVLLLQLGTPEAPTPAALRTFLREFLSDRRVIDLPPAIWLPILYLRVLPTRPAQSARLYRNIWTADGSPLAIITTQQAALLRQSFAAAGLDDVHVTIGMRYGEPSIARAVDELTAAGCDRLLAVSMYPQYASATVGSTVERLFEVLGPRRVIPALNVMPLYYDAPEYIDALAASARDALADFAPDHVLISFHGLPRRHADEGDPYPIQCRATAERLCAALNWSRERVTLSFQSRFGREEWLKPYTDETLRDLAARRIGRLAVICPGFTADCLETLEEMGITNRELYHAAGGGEYRLIPCLNTHPSWIQALSTLIGRHLPPAPQDRHDRSEA
jgi:ferrochelatase